MVAIDNYTYNLSFNGGIHSNKKYNLCQCEYSDPSHGKLELIYIVANSTLTIYFANCIFEIYRAWKL